MKMNGKILLRFRISVVAALLLGMVFLSVAQAGPPAQDPRPPVEGGGNGGGGGGGGIGGGAGIEAGGSSASTLGCASVSGQVLNWGFGPQDSVGLELKTGSWQTVTTSASDGNFGFGNLGVGIAQLHVALAPGLTGQLRPLVPDAAVYLNCNFPIVANIALSSGPSIEPPATLAMSAPDRLTPGKDAQIKLTVKNGLPNDITNVVVTDMIPQGLTALRLATTKIAPPDARLINGGDDGQLVVTYLDKLASDEEATITIVVRAAEDLAQGSRIRNTATLFYRESAADQAAIEFTVGSGSSTIPAASVAGGESSSGVSTPAEGASSGGEAFVPPGDVPTTGADFVPTAAEAAGETKAIAPDDMPTTGGTIGPARDDFTSPGNFASPGDSPTALDLPTAKSIAAGKPASSTDTPLMADGSLSKTPVVTGVSALLLLAILGLSSLGFLKRRSPLLDQEQE